MTRNMGVSDRMIRIAIALVLALLVGTGQITGTWAVIALVAGAVFVVTAFVRFCPLYRLLGLNTCRRA